MNFIPLKSISDLINDYINSGFTAGALGKACQLIENMIQDPEISIFLSLSGALIPAGQQKSNFICYIMEPETDDNLITWGYLDNFISVTAGQLEQLKEQEEQFKEQMNDMSQEEKDRMQQRLQRQRDRITNQSIPIYRLMKKTPLKSVLVEPFNEYEKKRYMKYR